MNGPQAGFLADGRLHLNHGPIDLIVQAFGEADEVWAAYGQATQRFRTILTELVEELPALRAAASSQPRAFRGATARRMEAAVCRLAGESFITPMAAVAGSVADEVLAAMLVGRVLQKAYVNNGGDSALHLARGQSMRLAVAGTGKGFADRILIQADQPVRGVATSGWRGRSFSLGIADAVTVLAHSGAEADAAATIIANAVDLPGHVAIRRGAACALAPDSDLGERLVTVGVGELSGADVRVALDAGLVVAEELRRRGLIEAAALFLDGEVRVCGKVLADAPPYGAPLWPAGHLPHEGGDSLSRRSAPIAKVERRAVSPELPISPRVGEMPGRAEGGATERKPLGYSAPAMRLA